MIHPKRPAIVLGAGAFFSFLWLASCPTSHSASGTIADPEPTYFWGGLVVIWTGLTSVSIFVFAGVAAVYKRFTREVQATQLAAILKDQAAREQEEAFQRRRAEGERIGREAIATRDAAKAST